MPQNPLHKIRYEYDKTGTSPDNLVAGETHVTSQRVRKIIVPTYGHFYTNSVSIINVATGETLPRSAYFFDDVSETIAMLTGLSAAGTIIIKDGTQDNKYSVTYQAVGGNFTNGDIKALAQKLEDYNVDRRPVEWDNIANKPLVYNPAEHFHPLWQTFGYEHLVYVIERLVQATLIGNEASHDVFWEALAKLKVNNGGALQELIDNLAQFKRETGDNFIDVRGLIRALGERLDLADSNLLKKINDHINAENPHNITPRKIGTLTEREIKDADNAIRTLVNELKDSVYNKTQIDTKVATISQSIQDLKDGKLDKTATAVNSNKLENKTLEQVLKDALDIGLGKFVQLGSGPNQVAPVVNIATGKVTNLVALGRANLTNNPRVIANAIDGRHVGYSNLFRGVIGDADLNSMSTLDYIGEWTQESANKALTPRHYPVNKAGKIIISPIGDKVEQIYWTYEGVYYYKRNNLSGSWSNWEVMENFRDVMSNSYTLNNPSTIASSQALYNAVEYIKGKISNDITTAFNEYKESIKAGKDKGNGKRYVELEEENGKVYVIFNSGGTVVRKQIFPAIWA